MIAALILEGRDAGRVVSAKTDKLVRAQPIGETPDPREPFVFELHEMLFRRPGKDPAVYRFWLPDRADARRDPDGYVMNALVDGFCRSKRGGRP